MTVRTMPEMRGVTRRAITPPMGPPRGLVEPGGHGFTVLAPPPSWPAPTPVPSRSGGLGRARPVTGRPRHQSRVRRRRPLRWSTVQRVLAFLLALVPMEIAGGLLSVKYHSVIGDAASRQANGYYVLFSRDPHLSAIGFVWNPLTSMSEWPLDLLHGIWPQLTREFLGASIMSALFMAGAAYQLYRFSEDLGVRWLARWLLLLMFVCNPLIFYFGANGMSEALFVFTLMAGARGFALWLHDRRLRPLIRSGIWLGLAYADRNEAAMAALVATALILWVSYRAAGGTVGDRRRVALADGVLFSAPFILSFLGWAIVSKLISGYFFDQFSSIYGNTSQLKVIAGTGGSGTAVSRFIFSLQNIDSMAPLLLLVAALAGVRAWRARDMRWLAPICFLGGVELFEIATFAQGGLATNYRYWITAIPLVLMLAACVARPIDKRPRERVEEPLAPSPGVVPRHPAAPRRHRPLLSSAVGMLAVLLVAPGLPTTTDAMVRGSAFVSERVQDLQFVFAPKSKIALASPYRRQWQAINGLAVRFADLHLHHGAIMVDNFNECIPQLILESTYPKEFRIPNDQDFVESEGVPYQDGVRYFLVSDPNGAGGYGALDALNRRYPGLYANGTGLATLSAQIDLPGCPQFRLYKLIPSAS